MKQNRQLYNKLLHFYNKCKRRLSNLIATGRNSNRQTVLQKHIERLYAKIMGLHANMQRGTVIASVALTAMAFNSNTAQAQTFGTPQTNPFNLASIGYKSSQTFADLDNDGDLDMLSGNQVGAFKYFQNTGTPTVPSYSAVVTNPFGLPIINGNASPIFVDIDNDGDMDILSGSYNGDFVYFQNTGTATAPAYAVMVTNPFGLTSGYYSCPTFADLDNDGDMDMLSGHGNGNFYYYQNTGTASLPAFAAASTNPFGLANSSSYTHPAFIDMDNDGDKDMMSGNNNGDFEYFQNTGTASAPAFATQVLNPFFLTNILSRSTPTFVDLDNNGDKELMSGDYYGGFIYFKQVTPGLAAALNFSGANEIVKMSASPALNNFGLGAFTLEAWVNPLSQTGQAKSIIRKTGDYNLYTSGGFLTAEVWQLGNTNPSYTKISATSILNLHVWQHVAFVWNGTTGAFYVNGALRTSNTTTSSYNGSENLCLGASSLFGQSYSGSLDEVRIWNVARTTCQINDYKNCEIPTTASGLVANYHFNQGMSPAANPTVTALTDASGSVYTGTLTNFGLTGLTSNWTAPGGVVNGYTVSGSVGITASSSAICMGNSTTLSVTGANTYTWSGGVTNGAAFSPTATASYTVVGTVTLTGCTNTVVSTVSVNALPTVSVTSGAICAGDSYTIIANGASSYTSIPALAGPVVTPTATTNYSITGTDVNGCVSSNTAVSSVTVNALPTVSVTSGAICAGNSYTIIANGASSYTSMPALAGPVVTPTATTNYSITGTDANGCVSSNAAVSSVTVNALPTVMATTSNTLLCSGQTASLTAMGAVSYTWNTSATNSVIAVTPTTTVTYTVNGVDANGCANLSTITQSVSACTDMQSTINSQQSFQLYPNPSNGSFTIELASDAIVSITNALGQVVMNTTMIVGTNHVALNDVTEGIYFVKVITGNTQTIIRLVVSK